MTLEEKLEQAFSEQEPSCHSCGWMNAFYELGDWAETGVVFEDGSREYHTPCCSKEADDPESHRGYFVYVNPK